jgi:hypothetical protein
MPGFTYVLTAVLLPLGALAAPQPEVTASIGFTNCVAVVASVLGDFAELPTPTGPLRSYLATATAVEADPCSWIASAPTSLSSQIHSMSSAYSSVLAKDATAIGVLSACAASFKTGSTVVASATALLHVTNCNAPVSVPTITQATKNAAVDPRPTAAAMAGIAAAAVVGVVGLI